MEKKGSRGFWTAALWVDKCVHSKARDWGKTEFLKKRPEHDAGYLRQQKAGVAEQNF